MLSSENSSHDFRSRQNLATEERTRSDGDCEIIGRYPGLLGDGLEEIVCMERNDERRKKVLI